MREKPNSEHKTFNLDGDVITLISEGSAMNGMSQSEFVEFLVNSWDENLNPLKNLKKIRTNKKLLTDDIKELEKAENLIMDNLEKVEKWRSVKQERKPEVITNLVRVLSEGRTMEAETIAKMQSISLGVPATQLIFEALAQLKKSGT